MNITLETMVKELERLRTIADDTDGYLSVHEIAPALKRSEDFVRSRVLRPLLEAGRLEIKKKTGLTLDGRRRNTPVYRVKTTKSAK